MHGQLVIGPPGSGKSTYCAAVRHYLSEMGRKVAVINLDPANDSLLYPCSVDISELITLDDVIDNLHLGPNGGLIYCMEYLEKNIDWLLSNFSKMNDTYVLIDCPGQIELYTHHGSLRNIFEKVIALKHHFVAVNLIDSHCCCDPSKFISAAVTSLSSMLQLALPHVNVLSKCDIIEKHGRLPMNLDFFTEVLDLSYLLEHLNDDPILGKFKKLNKVLCDIVEDYSLVSFLALDLKSQESMVHLMKTLDHAIGYATKDEDSNVLKMMYNIMDTSSVNQDIVGQVQERHMKHDTNSMDES